MDGDAPAENTITVRPDGPLSVSGDIVLTDSDGEKRLTDTRLTLCRCGNSAATPLCDDSHVDSGFRDPGEVGTDPKSEAKSGPPEGELTLTPVPGGPVMVDGEFRIEGGDGKSSYRAAETALCRCGASGNKPFCDGSHKATGFGDREE